jgi:hypothetical protein
VVFLRGVKFPLFYTSYSIFFWGGLISSISHPNFEDSMVNRTVHWAIQLDRTVHWAIQLTGTVPWGYMGGQLGIPWVRI